MTAGTGIDYQGLVRDALLGVVRRVLAQVAREGLPGEHHLYVSFSTRHPGVELPAALARQFPDEMTIVLQNQFWNLAVDDERLAVTLRFSGVPSRITIPWGALRSVVDPSVPFGLRTRATQAAPLLPQTGQARRPSGIVLRQERRRQRR